MIECNSFVEIRPFDIFIRLKNARFLTNQIFLVILFPWDKKLMISLSRVPRTKKLIEKFTLDILALIPSVQISFSPIFPLTTVENFEFKGFVSPGHLSLEIHVFYFFPLYDEFL